MNAILQNLNDFPGAEFGGEIFDDVNFDPSENFDVAVEYATFPDVYAPVGFYDFRVVANESAVMENGQLASPEKQQEIEASQNIERFKLLGEQPLFPNEPEPQSVLQIFNQYNGNYYNSVTAEPEAEPEMVAASEVVAQIEKTSNSRLLVYILAAITIFLLIRRKA